MLCTLCIFSHPDLGMAGVIVDEASQIELSGQVPLLGQHRRDIGKLVSIGDDM